MTLNVTLHPASLCFWSVKGSDVSSATALDGGSLSSSSALRADLTLFDGGQRREAVEATISAIMAKST